jgi:hypothetical protein
MRGSLHGPNEALRNAPALRAERLGRHYIPGFAGAHLIVDLHASGFVATNFYHNATKS